MAGQGNQYYYQLIYELLASPKERAGEILSARPELLDAQLVKLMGYLAVKLEIAGDSEPANRLRNLASDLAARMREASPVQFRKKLEADRLLQLGANQYDTSKFREALQSWQQALTLYREIKNLLGEADCLGNLGNACGSLGRYKEAIDYLLHQLKIARKIGNRHEEANSLNNLGNVYYYLGRYDEAIEYHQQSLKISRKICFRCGEANSLGNLGNAYHSLGLYDKARDYHQQKLEIAREIGERSGEVNSLGNLGDTYNHLGRYAEAIECQQQSLRIAREIGNRFGEANSLGNLGSVYYKLQQIPEAIQAFQSALAIFTPTGFPVECFIFGRNLGNTHFQEQQWDEAISAYEKALEAVEQRCAWEASPTGKQKLREEAVGVYENMVQACINTGNLRKALQTVERSKSRNLVELLENQELYPKGASKKDKQTLKQLRNSISAKQQLLEATGGEGGGSRAQVAGASGNPNFEYIEKQRQELENDRRKLDELLNRIKEYDPEFTLTQRVEPISFEDICRLVDAGTAILDWHIGTSSFQAFTLTRNGIYVEEFTQQELQELETWKDEYLGDYNPPQEEGESEEDWKKRKQQKLENWIKQLEPRLSKLAGILHLARILDKIPASCRQLIVIPHRYLHLFPLHALPVNRGESSDVSYLLDRFPDGVRYAPSCGLLQRVQARSEARSATVPAIPNTRRLFAIQNPTNDLPYSDSEVQKIETLFNPHTDILRKAAATKDALTEKLPALSRAGCAHFACHALFNFQFPLISSLILAGAVESSSPHPPTPSAKDGEGEKDTKKASRYLTLRDGKTANPEKCLTLLDVFTDVDLPQCRLVTLSACETGLTQTAQVIDEPIGLSTCFLYAGAVSVVCSLWRVSDLSTALLMVKFYEMRESEPSVARALNQAQIWLRTVTKANFLLWMQSQNLDPDDAGAVEDWLELFDSEEPPFSNPTHWAVFCAIGQ